MLGTHDFNLRLSAGTTEYELREAFQDCGEIDNVRLVSSKRRGWKGYGFVCFESIESVLLAPNMDNLDLNGRPMTVTKYLPKDKVNKTKLTREEKPQ